MNVSAKAKKNKNKTASDAKAGLRDAELTPSLKPEKGAPPAGNNDFGMIDCLI